jgi:hypothetical protein
MEKIRIQDKHTGSATLETGERDTISMIWLFFTVSSNVRDDGITELPYLSFLKFYEKKNWIRYAEL